VKPPVVLIPPVLAIVLLACGGAAPSAAPPSSSSARTSSPSSTPSPSASPQPACSASGTELEIVAEADATTGAHAFDRDCLAAPAGEAFTIRFDNRDHDAHNVEILDHPGGTPLFTGKVVAGPKVVTYSVKAMDPGEYYFRCSIHPLQMNGSLLAEE